MLLITLLILGGYFSYAMFTVSKEKGNAISIVTGNLTYKLEVDGIEDNKLVIPPGTIKDFTVTLTNPNNRIARFNLAYKEIEGITLGYLDQTSNIPPTETGINLQASGTSGSSAIYNLRVRNETEKEVTISLNVKVGLDYNDLTIASAEKVIGLYEDITLKDYIMTLRNEESNKDYTTSSAYQKTQLYTFTHQASSQQANWSSEELKDYRYIGEEPNNYIEFNNELWRIIGVFTVEDSSGSKKQLVKIIKDSELGKLSWDANANKTYKDIWSQAQLQRMLNSAYLNSTTMTYYNYNYRTGVLSTVNLDFRETGLKNVSKQIESVKWYTSAVKFTNVSDPEYLKFSTTDLYASERGTLTVSGGSTNWIGKVALPYPSDFAYTYAYNYNTSCYNTPFNNSNCSSKESWFQKGLYAHATIATIYSGRNIISATGQALLIGIDSSRARFIHPSIYLTSSLNVTGGTGTKEKPFTLSQ